MIMQCMPHCMKSCVRNGDEYVAVYVMNENAWRQPAVKAETLYLLNLLLLPGVAFVLLVALWWKTRTITSSIERSHLDSALRGSILAGVLIICVMIIMFYWGDVSNPYFWVTVVLYFTTVHTSLVLAGVVGISRALAQKPFYFPLLGGRRDV